MLLILTFGRGLARCCLSNLKTWRQHLDFNAIHGSRRQRQLNGSRLDMLSSGHLSAIILAVVTTTTLVGQSTSSIKGSEAPIPLTLREVVQMAIEASPDSIVERLYTQRADALLRAAKGAFDPVVRLGSDVRRESRPSSSVLEAPNGRVDEHFLNGSLGIAQKLPWSGIATEASFENTRQSSTNPFFALNPYYSPRVRFGFNVPLLRGRRTDSERTELVVRRLESQLSRSDFRLRLQDRAARAIAAYWALVGARNSVSVANQTRETALATLASTERLVREGEQPQAELFGAQGQVQRAEEAYADSVGIERQAQNALKVLLARSDADPILGSSVEPIDQEAVMPSQSAAELIAQAINNRPDLQSAAIRKQAQRQRVNLASNEVLPKADLQFNYLGQGLSGSPQSSSGVAIPGFDLRPPANLIGSTWTGLDQIRRNQFPAYSASLRLELPLRNYSAEGRLTEAKLTERQLQLMEQQLRIQVSIEVRQAVDAISAAASRIRAAQQAEAASSSRLESEIRLYREGQSNNLNLNIRQNELFQSRQLTVRARQALNSAAAELLRATGQTLLAFGIQVEASPSK